MGRTYKEVRQKVRFADNACCFQCRLPLDWCEGSREEGEKCVHMDKVLPVTLLALGLGGIQAIIGSLFRGRDLSNIDRFCEWLGESRRFHNTNGANIHVVWEEIIWQVYRKVRY